MWNITEVSPGYANPEINLYYMVVTPIICVLTVAGNSATINAFWKLPSLCEKPSETLILHLSITDLLTGLVVIPIFSPNYVTPGYWPLGEFGCRWVAGPIFNICVHTSILLLLAISLDRFLLVYKEYPKYVKIQSRSRIQLTIVGCWMMGVCSVIFEQSLWDVAKTLDESAANINYNAVYLSPSRRLKEFSLTFFLTLYFTPVLLVCVFSVAFLCLLRAKLIKNKVGVSLRLAMAPSNCESQQEQSTNAEASGASARSTTRNRYIKPAISLIALVSSMTICMLPYTIYVITVELFCQECNDPVILYRLLFLQFCNACLDPFLYALTQRKIQRLYFSCLPAVR